MDGISNGSRKCDSSLVESSYFTLLTPLFRIEVDILIKGKERCFHQHIHIFEGAGTRELMFLSSVSDIENEREIETVKK